MNKILFNIIVSILALLNIYFSWTKIEFMRFLVIWYSIGLIVLFNLYIMLIDRKNLNKKGGKKN